MNLDLLAQYLASKAIGVQDKNIFITNMPPDVRLGVLIRLPLDGVRIDYNIPGYYKTDFQIIVRAQRYDVGDPIAAAVLTAFTMEQEKVFPGFTIRRALPKTLPIVYPRSDSNGIEWSINVATIYITT